MRASVVIPCYGLAEYLPDALDSVLDQERPFDEVVIVDDGAPDSVEIQAIARSFGARCLSISNRGWASARNAGLLASTGEALCFLDADDWLMPEYLSLTLPLIEEERVGVVAVGLEADGVTVAGGYWPAPDATKLAGLPWANCVWSASLVRREALVECGGFNHRAGNICDWDVWIDIQKRGWSFESVDKPLYHWRDRSDGMHVGIDDTQARKVLRRNHSEVYQ